jgi:large subunit ribosomal protein L1
MANKKSKKYIEAAKLVDSTKLYSLEEAVELAKKASYSKFDGSIELAIRLGLDPRKSDQQIRGALVLPNGTGKDVRVLVITSEDKFEDAKSAGADFVGGDDMIEQISKGWFEFDTLIASPNMMAKIGKIGKILGPKGLMPNPKTGTVTPDVAKAVAEAKAGKVEYRLDKEANMHLTVGKVSFDSAKLLENVNAVIEKVIQVKPSGAKGTYIKNVSLAASMGVGVKVNTEDMK